MFSICVSCFTIYVCDVQYMCAMFYNVWYSIYVCNFPNVLIFIICTCMCTLYKYVFDLGMCVQCFKYNVETQRHVCMQCFTFIFDLANTCMSSMFLYTFDLQTSGGSCWSGNQTIYTAELWVIVVTLLNSWLWLGAGLLIVNRAWVSLLVYWGIVICIECPRNVGQETGYPMWSREPRAGKHYLRFTYFVSLTSLFIRYS